MKHKDTVKDKQLKSCLNTAHVCDYVWT